MMSKKEHILLYGGNLWYLGEGMFGPLLAVFAERLGGNVLDITWAWAVYLIVAGLLTVGIGKYSDGKVMSKEKLMVIGYALNAVFTFCYLLVQTPMQLFLLQAGLGLATAIASPTWYALYAKYEDKKEDGYEWGLSMGQRYMVYGIAILLGGFIVSRYSFTALFVVMGCVQVAATLYQAQILRKS